MAGDKFSPMGFSVAATIKANQNPAFQEKVRRVANNSFEALKVGDRQMELSEEVLKENSLTVANQVHALKVVDRTTYETMGNYVLTLRKVVRYFEDLYRPRITQADNVTKGLRADMRNLQAPALAAQAYGDGQLTAYDREQERIAREKQLKEQGEQDRREAEERKQLAELAKKAEIGRAHV